MNFFITAFLVLVVPLGLFLVWDQWWLSRKASEKAKHKRPYPAVPFETDSSGRSGTDGGGDSGCSDGGSCS